MQRRLALQKVDPDSIRAADWVKRNQDKLQRKVWGPVVLEMQVNEALHAKYLEDTLPKWLMAALVTECYEDYNTIIRELNSESSSQRIKASILIVQDGHCNPVQRTFTRDQIDYYHREFGISGFLDEVSERCTLIDSHAEHFSRSLTQVLHCVQLVNAPDVIHEVLRAHGGIHTVLVGTRQTEDIINRGGNIFSEIASPDRKAAFVTPFKKYVTSGASRRRVLATERERERVLIASRCVWWGSVEVRRPERHDSDE